MNTGAVFMMADQRSREQAMQEELATRLQGVRRQTTAEHIRKAARDLAVMGAACSLAAAFWREALPEGSGLWLAMAMPVSGLLYVAAVCHESRVRRATSSR